jgi:hypothetical protein
MHAWSHSTRASCLLCPAGPLAWASGRAGLARPSPTSPYGLSWAQPKKIEKNKKTKKQKKQKKKNKDVCMYK